MKGRIICIVIAVSLFNYSYKSKAQGSGNTLQFDGADDFVSLPASPVSTLTDFTIETWVYWTGGNSWQRVFDFGSNTTTNMFLTVKNSTTGTPRFAITTSGAGGEKRLTAPAALSTNVWHHIAITYNSATTTGTMYIDGVSVISSAAITLNPSNLGATTNNWLGKSQYGADPFYQGSLDEFRIWNVTRTQAQIRTTMCAKLVGNEAGLIANYRMDEGVGTTLGNTSINGGSLASASFVAGTAPVWALSSAPLGDVSAFNYPGAWAGQTVALASASNGSFTVSNVTGAPFGVHVYQVNAVPNSAAGITGLGTNNVYFGTFIANGAGPTYIAVYDYSGYPNSMANQASNALYIRADNSVSPWSASGATLNIVTNKLTMLGVNAREEFILGNTTVPLPLELISFTTFKTNVSNTLSWKVLDEKNVSSYQLEKSYDGSAFNELNNIPSESKSMNNYLYSDNAGELFTVYYRLKIIFSDGSNQYSSIISSNSSTKGSIRFYPQPFQENLTLEMSDKNSEISITDLSGFVWYTAVLNDYSITINTESLSSGTYILKIKNSITSFTDKIIKY